MDPVLFETMDIEGRWDFHLGKRSDQRKRYAIGEHIDQPKRFVGKRMRISFESSVEVDTIEDRRHENSNAKLCGAMQIPTHSPALVVDAMQIPTQSFVAPRPKALPHASGTDTPPPIPAPRPKPPIPSPPIPRPIHLQPKAPAGPPPIHLRLSRSSWIGTYDWAHHGIEVNGFIELMQDQTMCTSFSTWPGRWFEGDHVVKL